ncbi:hypothetical protein AVEN_256880-1 [Araneus ventricosus]|uniref:Uncharacterized protein n=1 Tax=Araneus ventricosus TaxID=182803 RepID=A0A4Y2CG92_ARAVE|nr:hypothetical protein AVEN_256880-1 [Araneus ventricosus]
MRAQFEVLIFRVTSVLYSLISQNGQEVENWRSASGTEIRTTDLVAMEITVGQQDGNHEVQRPTDWPVQKEKSNEELTKENEALRNEIQIVNEKYNNVTQLIKHKNTQGKRAVFLYEKLLYVRKREPRCSIYCRKIRKKVKAQEKQIASLKNEISILENANSNLNCKVIKLEAEKKKLEDKLPATTSEDDLVLFGGGNYKTYLQEKDAQMEKHLNDFYSLTTGRCGKRPEYKPIDIQNKPKNPYYLDSDDESSEENDDFHDDDSDVTIDSMSGL